MTIVTWYNYLYTYWLICSPEQWMLVTPDVREYEPANVGKSRNLRGLVLRVVRPDVCDKKLHEVDVLVGLIRHVPCDWDVKVHLDPPFDCVPQHGLV